MLVAYLHAGQGGHRKTFQDFSRTFLSFSWTSLPKQKTDDETDKLEENIQKFCMQNT